MTDQTTPAEPHDYLAAMQAEYNAKPLTERLLEYFDESDMECLPPVILEALAKLADADQARDEAIRVAGANAVAYDEARAETRRLGVSLAETIQERQQLRTRLADAEQTRRAALAVAADLTEDLAEARAETDRQRHEREKYTERWDALDQAAGALHGWTIYPTTDGGLMVSHDTDADRPTLASDDSIPLAAVLAFIASHTDDDTTE